MPKPTPGENREHYMNRCIPQVIKEGKPKDQAVAICASMWKEKKTETKTPMELIQ